MEKVNFEAILTFYKNDIASVRTGRATPALVEDVVVEAYGGQRMTIKELASISVPESRTVVIQPWDKGVLEAISSAIQKSSVGLAPIADGDLIRLNIPSLTEAERIYKIAEAKNGRSKSKNPPIARRPAPSAKKQ